MTNSVSPRAKPEIKLLIALSAALCLVCSIHGWAQDADAWVKSVKNITPAQGKTLLQIARDFVAQSESTDAQITACLGPVDEAASEAQYKEGLEESVRLAEGAARRMGYKSYAEIDDNDERVRMAKMLGEGRWLRQFRMKLVDCLKTSK